MVDCGLARRTVEERLGTLGRSPLDVTALLVTHEHGDHSQGVGTFSRRYGTPICATPGTAAAIPGTKGARGSKQINCHRELEIGSIAVEPYPVPHDAREPCQFVFRAGGRRLGVLTDTGHVTPLITDRLTGCDALAVECNHDLKMLHEGDYPPSVKARVASPYGHLNNAQTARLLESVQHGGLQWVVALHLSERNNSDGRARQAIDPILGPCGLKLDIATQDTPTAWFEIA